MPPSPPAAVSPFPIALLALAGFLAGMGIRATDALLPVIAEDFVVSVPAAGIIVTAFTLPYGLLQLVFGPLGDRFGKLRVVSIALGLYALATLACAAAGSLPQLVVLRAFAGGFAGGLMPLSVAYIGDAVPYTERQAAIGRYLTGVVMAQLFSGPVGGVFGDTLGWRGLFILLGGLSLAGAVAIARRAGPAPETAGAGFGMQKFILLFRRPASRLLMLGGFFDGVLLFGAFSFVGGYLRDSFGLPYTQVGLVVAAFGAGTLLYTRVAGWLVRNLGERRMLATGGALQAILLVALVRIPDWRFLFLVQAVMGLAFFMFHGVLQARSTEAMPEARATAVSGFSMMMFTGQALGALALAAAVTHLGWQASYAIWGAGVAVLTVVLTTRLRFR